VTTTPARWHRCSTCKKEIGFRTVYWMCSVTTCNRPRSALYFCSVGCWDSHVPIMRHRDAWAVEATSPSLEAFQAEEAQRSAPPPKSAPALRPAAPPSSPARAGSTARAPERGASMTDRDEADSGVEDDILIVVSKLKKYIRARSGFNTSDACMNVLSDHVRAICDRAIAAARAAERKTVLERDFPEP
jgi:hypothetical protein